ncbi:MAG: FadR/GntR family transcriptional regulator [Syntrophomonadaceae bacterium]
MSFRPIKTKRIYEEIMEQLKDMISRGELRHGQKLPSERELAESLGVSRASVREALTALEAIGILDIRPGEGTFIRETSVSPTFAPLTMILEMEQNPISQLMEVRRVLETEIAALAVQRATDEDLAKIEMNLKRMKSAKTISEAVEAGLWFHYAIAEATHNSILLRMMNTIADLMHNNYRNQREELFAENGPEVIAEHEAIYRAIRDRDIETAKLRILQHIDSFEGGKQAEE